MLRVCFPSLYPSVPHPVLTSVTNSSAPPPSFPRKKVQKYPSTSGITCSGCAFLVYTLQFHPSSHLLPTPLSSPPPPLSLSQERGSEVPQHFWYHILRLWYLSLYSPEYQAFGRGRGKGARKKERKTESPFSFPILPPLSHPPSSFPSP